MQAIEGQRHAVSATHHLARWARGAAQTARADFSHRARTAAAAAVLWVRAGIDTGATTRAGTPGTRSAALAAKAHLVASARQAAASAVRAIEARVDTASAAGEQRSRAGTSTSTISASSIRAVHIAYAREPGAAGRAVAAAVEVGLETIAEIVRARGQRFLARTAVSAAVDAVFLPVACTIDAARFDAAVHRAHLARAVSIDQAQQPGRTAAALAAAVEVGFPAVELAVGAVPWPHAPGERGEEDREAERA